MSKVERYEVRKQHEEAHVQKRIAKYGNYINKCDRSILKDIYIGKFTFKVNLYDPDSIDSIIHQGAKYLFDDIPEVEELSIEDIQKTIDNISYSFKEIHEYFFEDNNIENPLRNIRCYPSIYNFITNYPNIIQSFYNMKDKNTKKIRMALKDAIVYRNYKRHQGTLTKEDIYKVKLYKKMLFKLNKYSYNMYHTLIRDCIRANYQCLKAYEIIGRTLKYHSN